jgi:hypothetical protein
MRRAMYRRGADLGPGGDHPWAAPGAMTGNTSAVRVCGRGGGRGTRGCLTQRDELQGRIHGPAHQLAERALGRATVGHRGEHVFGKLRRAPDGNLRKERGRGGSRGVEPNPLQATLHGPETGPGGPQGTPVQGPGGPVLGARRTGSRRRWAAGAAGLSGRRAWTRSRPWCAPSPPRRR